MKTDSDLYSQLISMKATYSAFLEFRKGKRKTIELYKFERNLEDNIFALYEKLKDKSYSPGFYTGFYINDPKVRLINKTTLIDRLVHHVVSRGLEEIFDHLFIDHSYSCRKNKGTHKGITTLRNFTRKVSQNSSRSCFALKCDVKKFFASVNQIILIDILSKQIIDKDYLTLLKLIIKGFNSGRPDHGLPIGNLTSQYFANIYLNELDQYIKHKLKVKYYLRYTDDFIILHQNKSYLKQLIRPIKTFLNTQLDLELHPNKIKFLTLERGIDFLGYVVFANHIVPRPKTQKRIMRKVREKLDLYHKRALTVLSIEQSVHSYLAYLSHSNSFGIQREIIKLVSHEVPELSNKLWIHRTKV